MDVDLALGNYQISLCDLKKSQKEIIDKISYQDRILTDLDHLIENGKFPANIYMKIVMRRKKTLKQRRVYKDKYAEIARILNAIKVLPNKPNKNKKYTPRVLQETFKEYERYLK